MKTYTTKVEKPLLSINQDEDCPSPREADNLGYFITVDRKFKSTDGEKKDILQDIVSETGDIADSLEEHMQMIKDRVGAETKEKVVAIYPICKYEHGSVTYRIGSMHGFDYSNNGFYIITNKSQKLVGTSKKDFERVITEDLELYTRWANGEIYSFVLFDKDGEVEDSCSGFYSIEDIREYLPKEWKDEDLSEYIQD